MKDIRTTDYISEYEFRRKDGPRYQTPSLRPVGQDRRIGRAEDNNSDHLIECPTRERIQKRSEKLLSDRPALEETNNRNSIGTRAEGTVSERGTGSHGNRTQSRKSTKSQEEAYYNRGAGSIMINSEVSNPCDEQGSLHAVGFRKSSNKRGTAWKTGDNLKIIRKSGTETNQRLKRRKKRVDGDRKDGKKAKKAAVTLKSAISDMQQSANASWDTDQNGDNTSTWDFARDSAPMAKGFKKGIDDVIHVIVKVIKVVAATTLLPLILIMTGCLLIVITVLWAGSGSGGSWSGNRAPRTGVVTEKQIIYDGLMETFEGNGEAVIGVMCALMAESGCDPKATEAAGKWGISAAEYTAQVNDGTVSKEEFINSTYNGVQGSRGYGIAQWSAVDRKKALYEFAEKWAKDKGADFDVGDIEMQTAHLQETINTTYATLKQALIAETDMEEACYKWIAAYERPSEKYSTWREKAKRDVESYAEDIQAECERDESEGFFIWPCPSSHHIMSYFGNRIAPKEGASTDHKGIDIGASLGEEVIAAADGKVTAVDYNSARGYYIKVDHGNGYVTLYQHLSRQDVSVGDVVYQGDQIGAVGDTGISTAPHLHFEVHVNGAPVDPLQFFE